jgi:hypothetical protein
VEERKPVWATSSFLVYAGGLTVLLAGLGALVYLSSRYGDAAYAGWAALVFAVLVALANAFRSRGLWVAAGVFAVAGLGAWAVLLGALWTWFGWLHPGRSASASGSPFAGFSVARLSLELLVLAAASRDRRKYGFPLIRAVSAVVGWLFVTDLVSGGGSWSAVVTLLVGLVYLGWGSGDDGPAAFWLHLVGGLLIGGAVLYWWHRSDWEWALVAVLALAYVGVARRTGRSSWAVLAAVGILGAAAHFAVAWTRVGVPVLGGEPGTPRLWAPSAVFAFAGFLLVALGLGSRRRAPR